MAGSYGRYINFFCTLNPVFHRYCGKKKEMKEYTRKWKAILFSWIEVINIVKISILPKAIYGVTSIPIKVFHRNRTKKKILKFIWNQRNSEEKEQSWRYHTS